MKIHILIQGLTDFGFNGGLIWWIKDFLSKSPQRVVVDGNVSGTIILNRIPCKEQFYHHYICLCILTSLQLKLRCSVFLNMLMIWLS